MGRDGELCQPESHLVQIGHGLQLTPVCPDQSVSLRTDESDRHHGLRRTVSITVDADDRSQYKGIRRPAVCNIQTELCNVVRVKVTERFLL